MWFVVVWCVVVLCVAMLLRLLSDGFHVVCGGSGGTAHEPFVLEPGETITRVRGRKGAYVDSIQVTTHPHHTCEINTSLHITHHTHHTCEINTTSPDHFISSNSATLTPRPQTPWITSLVCPWITFLLQLQHVLSSPQSEKDLFTCETLPPPPSPPHHLTCVTPR